MSERLNLAFCGTPAFAVPTLEKLVEGGMDVSLVVTQPDKPRGRGLELSFSPVKQRALEFHLPMVQPERIRNNTEFQAQLQALRLDAIVVVGYGKIIPQWMIDLPPLGNLNLHASLLPKYRGAAPIQWAIASGEATTGVTTMRINAGLDTGDILQQREVVIRYDDTAVTLSSRLADLGASLMIETLHSLRAGTVHARAQDDAAASHAAVLKREDGLIDFTRPATVIYNRLRGFQPWPGAYTHFRQKSLHVWWAVPSSQAGNPGELSVQDDRLFAACGEQSSLELLEVQLEGKKRVSARDFVHGYHPRTGEKLG